ncbi:tyrosine-type recombinase/integrase [Campylobacterota bacterium DY0563]
MSNIRIKGDGVFKIRKNVIYVHGSVNGKFYRKSTGKKLTPATKQWMKKANPLDVLSKLLDTDRNEVTTNNFEKFGYMILEVTSSRRQQASQNELEGLFKNRVLPSFKGLKIEDIKPLDIVNLLERQKKEVCNDRVKRIKNLLNIIFDYAYDNELIERNPVQTRSVKAVDLSYNPKKTEAYSTEEIRVILKNAKGWFKIFLELSFKLGLRTGECMALKWSDINFETEKLSLQRSITRGVITEQNENSTSNKNHFRTIQLLPDLVKLLKIYYEVRPSNEWLFINKDGRYYRESKTIVDYHLKPLLKSIGVKYKTLYATRRSYASVMSFGGENLEDIQKIMGHSKGSRITEKHYIDPRILKLEHDKLNAQKQQEIFNMMVEVEDKVSQSKPA